MGMAELVNDETISYLSREKLIKLLGIEAAGRLVARFGGARLSVPAPGSPACTPLAEALGAEAARTLCAQYGGLRILLPVRLPQVSVKERIQTLARTGLNAPAIARELHTAERYVYRVLANMTD